MNHASWCDRCGTTNPRIHGLNVLYMSYVVQFVKKKCQIVVEVKMDFCFFMNGAIVEDDMECFRWMKEKQIE